MSNGTVVVTGATGFVGKAVCASLSGAAIPVLRVSRSLGVDICTDAFRDLCVQTRPSAIIHCAAYVGGIQFGYKHPAEIFYRNTLMMLRLLEAGRLAGVRRIVNPISNCSYPNVLEGPLAEENWWDGPLHESVLAYGFARKASWVGHWAYWKQYGLDTINLIVPNMYGPGDHFEEERSHALGALIKKIVDAHERGIGTVSVWGSGSVVREWLYVSDAAEILVKALSIPAGLEPINVGVGKGISIADLARLIADVVGYRGTLEFDRSKPDGAPVKIMQISTFHNRFGATRWTHLRDGIAATVASYRERQCALSAEEAV